MTLNVVLLLLVLAAAFASVGALHSASERRARHP